jgi:hypothetical protein
VVVLGSSGSGKSTFAVKDAARYRAGELHESKLYTTMYLQPSKRGFFQKKENMKNDLESMFVWIRKELESRCGSFEGNLKMHVSLVLDELGATNAFFEDPDNVNEARNHLSTLAESVRLIRAGSGVFANDLSSSAFAKCRMKSWESKNVTEVLTEKFGFSAKSATKAMEAIGLQPGLSSLLTNARAAFYVLSSLGKLSRSSQLFGDDLAKWLGIIKDGAPSLVASVVNSYSIMNVFSLLDDVKRRRVAAWAVCAIETATPGLKELPSLDGLEHSEVAGALSIIEHNLETIEGKAKFAEDGLDRAVLVTPAIVVFLYSMLGVPSEVFASLELQERITALYV